MSHDSDNTPTLIAVACAVSVATLLWQAWVASRLWAWHIVPLGLGPVSAEWCVGGLLLTRLLVPAPPPKAPKKTAVEALGEALGMALAAAIALCVGASLAWWVAP